MTLTSALLSAVLEEGGGRVEKEKGEEKREIFPTMSTFKV
jgi:hypothetical protein